MEGMEALRILESKRAEIEALCRKYNVLRLRVFGSALREDWDPETSDFDFLAEFAAFTSAEERWRQVDLILALEELLGRPVDVVDWGAARDPRFMSVAAGTARLFYAA